jgi:K+-transporting ATPase KdpF subunit
MEVDMLSIVAIAAIVIAVGLAAVLAYAATKPDRFTIQRSTTIKASPDRIFPLIDDLHAHTLWTPFEKDPNMTKRHSGAARGKGAVYEWDGNRQVGAGRLEIIDVMPRKIAMTLNMLRPMKAHNLVEFTLQPVGNGTRVTWAMQGAQPYLGKLMSTVIDCDKMVGSEFERGLAKLKAIVEQPAPEAAVYLARPALVAG